MKTIKKITAALAALALAFALGSCANGTNNYVPVVIPQRQTGKVEFESIDRVFSYDYEGDYNIDALIEADISDPQELVNYLIEQLKVMYGITESDFSYSVNAIGAGCCSIVANNAGSAGGKIYGRNYDYPDGSALVIHTKPDTGYESVTTAYPYFLTGDYNWQPSLYVPKEIIGYCSIFAPLDGMNEKGFYISILEAGDNELTAQSSAGKHDTQTTVAVRYLLDKADSVAKALELLENLNMHSIFGTAYHFAMADTTGKSVVVEYINNQMKVTDTKVVTNHYITPNSGKPAPQPTQNTILRYNAAYNAGEAANWNMTPEQVRDALKAAAARKYNEDPASTHISIWSVVYEPNAKKITYYFRENFDQYAEITLGAAQ